MSRHATPATPHHDGNSVAAWSTVAIVIAGFGSLPSYEVQEPAETALEGFESAYGLLSAAMEHARRAAASNDDRLMASAEQLIGQMTQDWHPEEHVDVYRNQLAELLEAKATGAAPPEVGEQQPAPVLDLVEALRRSVARAQTEGGDDLSSLSRAELSRRAKDRSISGRSKMSTHELREALEQAS